MNAFFNSSVAYKHIINYICSNKTYKAMNDSINKQVEKLSQSYNNQSDTLKKEEEDTALVRSNSYYTKAQEELMVTLSASLGITSSELRRTALLYFLEELETGKLEYVPGEITKTDKLKNSQISKGMIAKTKRFAKVFSVSSGQFRRDALEYYNKSVAEGKINFYKMGEEFLGNIQNEETPPYKAN